MFLTLLLLCLLFSSTTIFLLILWPSRYSYELAQSATAAQTHYQVLVLGDVGRSPRMQYHALSIANTGANVDVIGYLETSPLPELSTLSNVDLRALSPAPPLLRSSSVPFLITGPLKVIWQTCDLFIVLAYKTAPARWLVVQNPPSIPTLAIASLVCALRRTRLLIDWHNYGWTILAGTKGPSHPFVRISKLYECVLGRIAPIANLTVTNAMLRELQQPPYGIKTPIVAMHDRPAAIFQPVKDTAQRREWLQRLADTKDVASDIMDGRLRLIVSSTSWTQDEDFSILLDALCQYASSGMRTPILAIITGKGPQKQLYLDKIATFTKSGKLPGVIVKTAFLSFEDYAKLLAVADLGVCLHKSSSGVDLPMKVVDMFGAGLPVAAYNGYESFGELVKEGVNGRGFEDAGQLANILARLLDGMGETELAGMKRGAVKEGSRRWDQEWDEAVAPVLGLKKPKRVTERN